jgi:hypothetical protein
MRMPTLYLKWKAYKAFVDDGSSDKEIAEVLFPGRVPDVAAAYEPGSKAASTFAKRLSGEVALEAEVADLLVAEMNRLLHKRKAASKSTAAPLVAGDLALPTLSFVSRLVEQWPTADKATLDRMHQALLAGLRAPVTEDAARLVIDRYDGTRSFGADAAPSGGVGPLVFEAGRHKGQVAVLGETRVPLAAFTMFTRNPETAGKRLWDLAWGEAVLWLPAPSVPVSDNGRLLLMAKPEPVHATPGRFTVTSALVWTPEALAALDPQTKSPRPDEAETAAFLTKLRSLHKYRRNKWAGAVSILSADYVVQA